ncbi:MAG: FAD-binding protein, partial [Brachybacterium tyrofermentans]
MPTDGRDEQLRSLLTDALDPALARPAVLGDMLVSLRGAEAEGVGWAERILSGAPDAGALVGDLLYARGLTPENAGPDLAPHVDSWSAPGRDRQEPLLLEHSAFATPQTITEQYDAIVIGSGAGGGMAAQTLAQSGRRVLVVERGDLPRRSDLLTDHLRTPRSGSGLFPHSGPGPDAEVREVMLGDGPWRDVGAGAGLWSNNAMTIGGGTRMYGAQAWRFGPKDLAMASTYGVPEGSSLADWPLTYDELEPYYTRVEQMLGVSGGPSTDPWEGPRSAPL